MSKQNERFEWKIIVVVLIVTLIAAGLLAISFFGDRDRPSVESILAWCVLISIVIFGVLCIPKERLALLAQTLVELSPFAPGRLDSNKRSVESDCKGKDARQ